jgi:hypothetical protein
MSGGGKRVIPSSSVQIGSEAHSASYSVGTRSYFPGSKAAGHDADDSPYCADIKNMYVTLFPTPYAFMACPGTKLPLCSSWSVLIIQQEF